MRITKFKKFFMISILLSLTIATEIKAIVQSYSEHDEGSQIKSLSEKLNIEIKSIYKNIHIPKMIDKNSLLEEIRFAKSVLRDCRLGLDKNKAEDNKKLEHINTKIKLLDKIEEDLINNKKGLEELLKDYESTKEE